MDSQSIINALQHVRLALSACHGCLCTDRPDLPIDDDTSWSIDNAREIALIDRALHELGATHHIDVGCTDRSTDHETRRS